MKFLGLVLHLELRFMKMWRISILYCITDRLNCPMGLLYVATINNLFSLGESTYLGHRNTTTKMEERKH